MFTLSVTLDRMENISLFLFNSIKRLTDTKTVKYPHRLYNAVVRQNCQQCTNCKQFVFNSQEK